jgi:hypothetical protein
VLRSCNRARCYGAAIGRGVTEQTEAGVALCKLQKLVLRGVCYRSWSYVVNVTEAGVMWCKLRKLVLRCVGYGN